MLVNPRLSMNSRLALSCFFLGILTALLVLAAQWVLEARRESTHDLPGEVTVLDMRMVWWPRVWPAEAMSAQAELLAYLRDRSLALVVSSCYVTGGRPEVFVYDPHGFVPWFPRATPEAYSSVMSGAYLFEGTYSERRWSKAATTPLLPRGVVVEGVIPAPPGAGTRQYARRIGHALEDMLPPGNYIINTTDSGQLAQVLGLLHRMGFVHIQPRRFPLMRTLALIARDPFVFVPLLFLLSGHACAVLYWALYLRARAEEFGLRSRYGAGPAALVRENLVGGLPGLVAGSVAGALLSGLLTAAVGQVRLPPGNFEILTGAGIIAAAVATVTWSATLIVVIRSRPEVRLLA
ncbi:MAG: hypothetical protein RDU89_12045 [bacterium]|nr:hypothetical protein [bacterium]